MADKLDLIPVSAWDIFPETRPLVIAGPCAAENESQVLETARGIAAAGIRVFRSGIWKPRTHPGCFEGAGERGLPWLLEARKQYGLKVCTEVARPAHVEACLRHGVDMVWIGARTTANPFQVQELADALAGSDIPVLVKNPVSPDLDLWIGALERLNRAGIRKLGVVHRGFSSFQAMPYRNDPGWRIPIELRTIYPRLPFFADPSHMGGDRKFLRELSQRSLDLGADGLMIESHCNPACALSDAQQQLTPEDLRILLTEKLIVRNTDPHELDNTAAIRVLRERIDRVDGDILSLLKARMTLSREIGNFKRERNIAILQTARWDGLMEDVIRKGKEGGLEEHFLRTLFNVIHEESIRVQNDILAGASSEDDNIVTE